ncbi:MAG: hypothetical protein AABZ57_05695 [Candidatus Margulisiibacteriota bacterium]
MGIETYQYGAGTVRLSPGLAFVRAQAGAAQTALNEVIDAYLKTHRNSNPSLSEIVEYAIKQKISLPTIDIDSSQYGKMARTAKAELLEADAGKNLDNGFQLRPQSVETKTTTSQAAAVKSSAESPTISPATQPQIPDGTLGYITLTHHSHAGRQPDSTVMLKLEKKGLDFTATRLNTYGAPIDPETAIHAASPKELMEKLKGTLGKDGGKKSYSIQVEDEHGMIVANLEGELAGLKSQECEIGKETIRREEKQYEREMMKWKIELWQALLDMFKNLGIAGGFIPRST